ncbi:electron transfer flavoprotein subunit alpha/FixB family protein [Solitalea sp. MAHUQ-68]|uniref:Electron transfer flavoprotein subunit alpha/FixB family protein n=1 Tax=Solitalea agri TaxID=2953739 RepID=A0A9X2JDM9_9SPHI|nr:electron transfer flavoprotein subunit alpha/FixB family protein [Solitalea agri]MCO4291536.1 electron transfer flavoprotein subunit alpha/FixB family protein [Solitalea agri]
MSVLVYVENADGKFKKSTFEVVSYAKEIANQLGTSLTALSIGNVADGALAELGKYGAQKVLTVNNDKLKSFVNQAYASIISSAAKAEGSKVVVLAASFSGKGLAPRVAVKLEAGLVDGAVELPDLKDGKFTVKKTAFSGKAFAHVELTSAVKIVSLVPNSFKVVERPEAANVTAFESTAAESDFGVMIKDIVRASDKISLPDAELVVSAGRGMKGPENWGMVEELANLLGAATACSKPVSDAGWRPHSEHVGQTGIAISPNLYIAIGISGAIQHLAGVSSSKVIVVINKDPEAPFFKVADYGIVGDAFEVLPKLIDAIKKFKEAA